VLARTDGKHLLYAILEKAMAAVIWLGQQLADVQLPGDKAAAAAVEKAVAAAGVCSSIAELSGAIEAAWQMAYTQLRASTRFD
jgi:hypothetical protein